MAETVEGPAATLEADLQDMVARGLLHHDIKETGLTYIQLLGVLPMTDWPHPTALQLTYICVITLPRCPAR